MPATATVNDPDIFRLRALLERLDPREGEPCNVEGCTHCHPIAMQEREAA